MFTTITSAEDPEVCECGQWTEDYQSRMPSPLCSSVCMWHAVSSPYCDFSTKGNNLKRPFLPKVVLARTLLQQQDAKLSQLPCPYPMMKEPFEAQSKHTQPGFAHFLLDISKVVKLVLSIRHEIIQLCFVISSLVKWRLEWAGKVFYYHHKHSFWYDLSHLESWRSRLPPSV